MTGWMSRLDTHRSRVWVYGKGSGGHERSNPRAKRLFVHRCHLEPTHAIVYWHFAHRNGCRYIKVPGVSKTRSIVRRTSYSL